MNLSITYNELINKRLSHVQVTGKGHVSQILNDDLSGSKHQRFVLRLGEHQTLMIINNIDIFPRLDPIEIGDLVEFCGDYVWNRHGGVVHWTHEDPNGVHSPGYVKLITEKTEKIDAESSLVPKGEYKHYSGNVYYLLDFGYHSITLEKMAIYSAVEKDSKIWIASMEEWNKEIEVDGKLLKNFSLCIADK
ncbi:MAG: DUF1653 domain-containing protein [Christensenellaceae bacterium]|jgi:hypothetical protein|nr:DUF1653 domain-containing protein [Christensenellaceae bacterium]